MISHILVDIIGVVDLQHVTLSNNADHSHNEACGEPVYWNNEEAVSSHAVTGYNSGW